jgi:hypothetical protein
MIWGFSNLVVKCTFLSEASKWSRNGRFELRDLDLIKQGIFTIFRKPLNEFWDFYHGTSVGAGSHKAGGALYLVFKIIELSIPKIDH